MVVCVVGICVNCSLAMTTLGGMVTFFRFFAFSTSMWGPRARKFLPPGGKGTMGRGVVVASRSFCEATRSLRARAALCVFRFHPARANA